MRHRFEHDAAGFLRERLERGEDFARARVAFEGWSRARLAAMLVALPLLPAVPLARGARDALRSRRVGAFLATLPLQLLGHAAWCAGEARAHRAALSRTRAGARDASYPGAGCVPSSPVETRQPRR